MIPSMYKIAGELTSAVFHVSARTIATHALSIFGDHSDINAVPPDRLGPAFLRIGAGSARHGSVIAQAATRSIRAAYPSSTSSTASAPRTRSTKSSTSTDDDLRHLIDDDLVRAHREQGAVARTAPSSAAPRRTPTPSSRPRGHQPLLRVVPVMSSKRWTRFAERTGREYKLFDYVGDPEAERVIVIMGSGAEAVHETVGPGSPTKARRSGLLKVRLYRPFSASSTSWRHCRRRSRRSRSWTAPRSPAPSASRSTSTSSPPWHEAGRGIQPLRHRADRCRRPLRPVVQRVQRHHGQVDLRQSRRREARNHFTVGIIDDVSHTSLPMDDDFNIAGDDVFRGLFFGLGSDGTVGRQQELDQDHRRGDRQLRPGLLCLRLQEGRRGHHLPPPLRARSDPLVLS